VSIATSKTLRGAVNCAFLPNYYDAESVYTHFTLVTPTGCPWSMDHILEKDGYAGHYSLDPSAIRPVTNPVADPNAMHAALRDVKERGLVTTYGKNMEDIELSRSFLIIIDDSRASEVITKSVQDLFVPNFCRNHSLRRSFLSLIGPPSKSILDYSSMYLDVLLKRLLALDSPIDEVPNHVWV
jgi:hypothetical protein